MAPKTMLTLVFWAEVMLAAVDVDRWIYQGGLNTAMRKLSCKEWGDSILNGLL